MISGIYQIKNIINNKIYIGSAINLYARFRSHKFDLRNNKHSNNKLQNSWNKNNEKNFIFEIIETCKKEILIEREQYYLDILKPEYNICKIAYSRIGTKNFNSKTNGFKKGNIPWNAGLILSEKHKEKLRESHKNQKPTWLGKKFSKEHINNLSNSLKGRKPWNKGIKTYIRSNTKLTIEQVIEIREKYIPKIYTHKMLAYEYNVSSITIKCIISRKLWSNI